MNPFFSLLSAVYIFLIFWGADSPVVPQISVVNPFSLLHIPLYGFLTLFLLLAFCPSQGKRSKLRVAIAAGIALVVGCLDELHQLFIPNRDGSATDVLIDAGGILLALILFPRLPSFFPWFLKKMRILGIDYL